MSGAMLLRAVTKLLTNCVLRSGDRLGPARGAEGARRRPHQHDHFQQGCSHSHTGYCPRVQGTPQTCLKAPSALSAVGYHALVPLTDKAVDVLQIPPSVNFQGLEIPTPCVLSGLWP